MRSRNKVSGSGVLLVVGSLLLLAGCASMEKMSYTIDSSSSAPGRSVKLAGEVRELGGTPIMVGSHLPESYMIDAFSLRSVDISQMKGKVLFLSLVPSLEKIQSLLVTGKILLSPPQWFSLAMGEVLSFQQET